MPAKINGLTTKQTSELRQLLLSRKDELMDNIQTRAATGTKVEADQVKEDFDQATSNQDQAVTLRVMDKEVKLLREIDRALAKFEAGEYGLCEGTDEPIGYRRLKVVPWARYSVELKEQREREELQRSVRPPGR